MQISQHDTTGTSMFSYQPQINLMKCNVSILQYLSTIDKKDDDDIFDSQGPMSMDDGFLCLI
jgi:hypothetical protein